MIGIYARVSTEEQAKSGFSLESQVRECRKKSGTNECKEYIDEGVSGEFLDRPALSQLRQDVRDGLITKVVCLDPDRLSRKLMHQLLITEEFDRQGIELVFVNGEYARTPEGQLFYSMRGAIAEFEKAKINERMSRGRREKARQGRVLRDFQVYGYSYNKETEQMIINEEEAAIVRLIFDLFTKPGAVQGMNGIAHYLTKQAIPTKKGKGVWHRQVVRQILMNRAYIGEFYQNRWNTEGMLGNKHKAPDERVPVRQRPREEWIHIPCPPIIEREQFEYAQKLLQDSRRRWAKKGLHQYLLSGLLRCAHCGNTMTGRRAKNWGKYVYEYTDIKSTAGAKNRGCGRKVKREEFDNEIWKTVRSWLENPNEIAAAAEYDKQESEIPFEQMEMERLEKEIEKAKKGRKRILSLFAIGMDSGEEEVCDIMRTLKEKEETATKQLKELKARIREEKEAGFNQNLLSEAAEYYLFKHPDALTFDDKQKIIRQLIREIIVYEDHIEIFTY
ncbi:MULTISPECIES: recombinase family protein [Aneurinibacillus]|uniref:Recombinase family protein n=1 Tax=Aneurinibacillus thermoaerophilus TaxID=143495 RepID=A0A1G7YG71_ANETH|nr:MULTISPECIES: recombinase family protein [Aneurinibacillus]AMA72246.1 DNA recombinase [Aneurinibacillus sp. XH2]MED0681012.1 recombinase family protein [Aneurinibacillus thermoaerophilus]MED0738572.1 recombinase family protein [Aneurinibacillus thermoaerophilus]MED0757763.1 recombinase family protein [Aneurinibacillus thermoaerophilus]MED0762550.1 recombinase family protein [Aneurinibacillus thermoaerophilus]